MKDDEQKKYTIIINNVKTVLDITKEYKEKIKRGKKKNDSNYKSDL